MPKNIFRYELLPFVFNPGELAVLKCVNRAHFSLIDFLDHDINLHLKEIARELEEPLGNILLEVSVSVVQFHRSFRRLGPRNDSERHNAKKF